MSHILTGENHLTLPHTYSLTEQLRLFRNLLVWEDGKTLRLAHAVPRTWLESGKSVAANEATTMFGPVSYSITSKQDGTMSVHLVPPRRQPPAAITVRLRHPEYKSISKVTGSTLLNVQISAEIISIKDISAPADLIVRFK